MGLLGKVVKKTSLYIVIFLLTVFTAYPFIYMLSTSFKNMQEFFTNPFSIILETFTLDQYVSVFEMGLGKFFINSLLISVMSVLIVVIVSALASYPLSRMKFRLNKPLFLLFVGGMMIPVHATLIPIFIMSNDIGLYDKLFALLGPYVAFALPISIVIFTQFMSEIPIDLENSAKIDGAGHWRIFLNVIMPSVKPAIATIVIYNFVHIWNEFIFALILIQSPEKNTLPLGLKNFYGEFSVNVPGLMAAISLGTLPLIIVFILAQERVVEGLLGGAIKG